MTEPTAVQPSKTVYCYYFPEVREIISEIGRQYPHDIFLQSIDPGLDHFHEPIIDSYVDLMKGQAPGLGNFPYRYTSNGASEAIFHILAHILSTRPETPLYVFEGEYEGYAGYGNNLGLNFKPVPYDVDSKILPKGIFFISNPSARDGNIIPNEKIKGVLSSHEVVLDLTYMNLTAHHEFDVEGENILAVLTSMSKPFGLYYYRIGFTFMKEELLTLSVNKWFKNIFSHIVADKVIKRFSPSELYNKYSEYQDRAVEMLSSHLGFKVEKSDVLILAHIPVEKVPESLRPGLEKFKRGLVYRFCLTPYFLEIEKHSNERN